MISFSNIQLDDHQIQRSNTWYQIDATRHCFKLPITFQGIPHGTALRVQDLNQNRTYPEHGFFLPLENYEMSFITDFSNTSTEIISQLYASHDIYCMENEIVQNYFYYKIPWYHIPKNYLEYQPKHLIMMFNMGYLTQQQNPNNAQPSNLYYNTYYHGIDISQQDIESAYVEHMLEKVSMENIIIRDYLNL